MTMIPLNALDGGSIPAYLARPAGASKTAPAPGVVVIQEIFGINRNVRTICDHLAAAGFIALAPDLFWRQQPGVELTDQNPGDWDRAMELMRGMDQPKAVEDLKAGVAYLRQRNDCNNQVGCQGYCLGGRLAYLMAAHSDVDCSVGYYGVGIEGLLHVRDGITRPLLLHFAELDSYCPPEALATIRDGLADRPETEIHLYPAVDHGFARINGIHYDSEAAHLADRRSLSFLTRHLTDQD